MELFKNFSAVVVAVELVILVGFAVLVVFHGYFLNVKKWFEGDGRR